VWNVSGEFYAANVNRPISVRQPPWTDSQLVEAIKTSTNWRSVMLLLGLADKSRSAGAIRVVRRRAAELGLDSSHFRGKRRWSDAQLRQAVAECQSWSEVLSKLGLSGQSGNAQPHIKSHTVRLGLETSHLNRVSHLGRPPAQERPDASDLKAQLKYLRTAAESLAAAWFTFRGCAVSLPTTPAAYDLLVDISGGISRVQVKTTTRATKYGWEAGVGHHPDTHSKKGHLLAYDPDEIDLFFIVDGDMTLYLIPSRAIAGRVVIALRTYAKYIVGNARGLLDVAAGAGTAHATALA
jgi:PD-(D/E)XK endonuclease